MTHGFDNSGVQFDEFGGLNPWLDETTQKNFNKMAQCVIDQYSGFCLEDQLCVNGRRTQGENIADNGGITI